MPESSAGAITAGGGDQSEAPKNRRPGAGAGDHRQGKPGELPYRNLRGSRRALPILPAQLPASGIKAQTAARPHRIASCFLCSVCMISTCYTICLFC